jgi:hypothetical protein
MKSARAYLVCYGPNAIAWKCKKQTTIAKSSTEAEYCTITSTVTNLLWLSELFKELHLPIVSPPVIHSDNKSATFLCANPMFHSRMKHLAIDCHFMRDLVLRKSLHVLHVPSVHQLADLLTKPLGSS